MENNSSPEGSYKEPSLTNKWSVEEALSEVQKRIEHIERMIEESEDKLKVIDRELFILNTLFRKQIEAASRIEWVPEESL